MNDVKMLQYIENIMTDCGLNFSQTCAMLGYVPSIEIQKEKNNGVVFAFNSYEERELYYGGADNAKSN